MAAVTGIGGVFLRVDDPEALFAWYEEHLGLARSNGGFGFAPETQRAQALLVFLGREDATFPQDQPAMLNLQVDDLDAVLDRLVAAGAEVDPNRATYDFGRFGSFTDPAGNRVELWEPR